MSVHQIRLNFHLQMKLEYLTFGTLMIWFWIYYYQFSRKKPFYFCECRRKKLYECNPNAWWLRKVNYNIYRDLIHTQHHHNNHTTITHMSVGVGFTLMWRVVVWLLCWWCKFNIFHIYISYALQENWSLVTIGDQSVMTFGSCRF
jgi:hypothetical protein